MKARPVAEQSADLVSEDRWHLDGQAHEIDAPALAAVEVDLVYLEDQHLTIADGGQCSAGGEPEQDPISVQGDQHGYHRRDAAPGIGKSADSGVGEETKACGAIQDLQAIPVSFDIPGHVGHRRERAAGAATGSLSACPPQQLCVTAGLSGRAASGVTTELSSSWWLLSQQAVVECLQDIVTPVRRMEPSVGRSDSRARTPVAASALATASSADIPVDSECFPPPARSRVVVEAGTLSSAIRLTRLSAVAASGSHGQAGLRDDWGN